MVSESWAEKDDGERELQSLPSRGRRLPQSGGERPLFAVCWFEEGDIRECLNDGVQALRALKMGDDSSLRAKTMGA